MRIPHHYRYHWSKKYSRLLKYRQRESKKKCVYERGSTLIMTIKYEDEANGQRPAIKFFLERVKEETNSF